MSESKQANLEGDVPDKRAKVSKRARPQVRIATDHYVLKKNAKVLANLRQKGPAKIREKIKVRKEKTADVAGISKDRMDEEFRAIVHEAMNFDFPDYDEEWETLQQPTRSGGLS